MANVTYTQDDFIIPDKISKDDKAFITGEWLETINKAKSLEASQKSLLDLLKNKNKTNSDILVLKSFIKGERYNYDTLNASRILAEKMDKDFISVFRKAISDKKMLTADMSYKQAIQKMIDDKVITNASLYTEFLDKAPDGEVTKADNSKKAESDKTASDDTAPAVDNETASSDDKLENENTVINDTAPISESEMTSSDETSAVPDTENKSDDEVVASEIASDELITTHVQPQFDSNGYAIVTSDMTDNDFDNQPIQNQNPYSKNKKR